METLFYGVYVDVFTVHKSLQYVFTQKELNLLYRRWLEFLKDYEMSVYYHPGKKNVVADAFSRLSMGSVDHVYEKRKDIVKDVHRIACLGVNLMSISDSGRVEVLSQGRDGVLRYQDRLCVPDVGELRQHIPAEAHNSRYSIHPVKITYSADDDAKLYLTEIVRLHGVPLSIISDRGPQFTSHLWKSFQKGLNTQVNLSKTFHTQTDGQEERTIQTLEDMLRACVIDFKGSWDDNLPLIVFFYNNSYHSSI
ncbi:uncharacterized protein [Solanum lycopersicum]|uniref:uncharacterized protein n=1 Tax=Solanum lycopersicum TaxID=4081 RepID=UPI0037490637